MPNVTGICYLSSLLFYGMGYSKVLVIKNVITESVNTYEYTTYVSLATGYFVLAIFFALIGSFFFYVKKNRDQEIQIFNLNHLRLKVKSDRGRGSNDRKRANVPSVAAQLTQLEYGLDLDRRMSS